MNSADCIIPFAKQPGLTSFSSLYTIKHALKTTKVGHTGTLDSFASGLLVVCAGSLTRLAGKITEFDKTYQAVVKFGAETDTLEYTGTVVKTAHLPTKSRIEEAVNHFTGEIMQTPPSFSAIHIDGKRASDIARQGKAVEIPARKITVYSANIMDFSFSDDGLVDSVLIEFSVSKGTYIRSLARDIGQFCQSAAHLTGLYRTKIGNFRVEDAAGFELLEPFSIKTAEKNVKTHFEKLDNEDFLQEQVLQKSVGMSRELAKQCGFSTLTLKPEMEKWFSNGGKLSSSMFDVSPFSLSTDFAAVFTQSEKFAGLLQKDANGYFRYSFVVK